MIFFGRKLLAASAMRSTSFKTTPVSDKGLHQDKFLNGGPAWYIDTSLFGVNSI